jgi:hypothetical protein
MRAPIVYLRSFASDEGEILSSWWKPIFLLNRFGMVETDEEALSRIFSAIGPFVAIGNPSEWLPTRGALRIYRTDENWREAVRDLMARACLVIVRVGNTPGLLWELNIVASLVDNNKVVFWNPTHTTYTAKGRKILATFANVIGEIFRLRHFSIDCKGLFFVPSKNQYTMERRFTNPIQYLRIFTGGRKAVDYQLMFEPILDRINLSYPKLKIRRIEIVNFIFLVCMTSIIIALLWKPWIIFVPFMIAKGFVKLQGAELISTCGADHVDLCHNTISQFRELVDLRSRVYFVAFWYLIISISTTLQQMLWSIIIKLIGRLLVLLQLLTGLVSFGS